MSGIHCPSIPDPSKPNSLAVKPGLAKPTPKPKPPKPKPGTTEEAMIPKNKIIILSKMFIKNINNYVPHILSTNEEEKDK